jgi:hypothetical protein
MSSSLRTLEQRQKVERSRERSTRIPEGVRQGIVSLSELQWKEEIPVLTLCWNCSYNKFFFTVLFAFAAKMNLENPVSLRAAFEEYNTPHNKIILMMRVSR